MTSEISREEFEVEFKRLEGEWEVLKKEAGIKEYNKRKFITRKKEEEIEAEELELKARKIVERWNDLKRKAGIDIAYDIQINMLYQINKKYNVETGIKMFIGNVVAIVGILLFLQTISPQLTNLIHFPEKYIFAIIVAIVVKLTGTAHLETLKNILDN